MMTHSCQRLSFRRAVPGMAPKSQNLESLVHALDRRHANFNRISSIRQLETSTVQFLRERELGRTHQMQGSSRHRNTRLFFALHYSAVRSGW